MCRVIQKQRRGSGLTTLKACLLATYGGLSTSRTHVRRSLMQQPQPVRYVLFLPGCMAWRVWTCAHKSLLRAPGPALSDSEFPFSSFFSPPFDQSHCRGDRRRKHWTARCHWKSGVGHLHTYLTALALPIHVLRENAINMEALTASFVYSYLFDDLLAPRTLA